MKDFIETEKRVIQDFFYHLNDGGCRIKVFDGSSTPFIDTIAVQFIVTRIAPHFDSKGDYLSSDFWLLWKEIGYQEGVQFAHTIKVVACRVEDAKDAMVDGRDIRAWLSADLTDDLGRRHRVELIDSCAEPNQAYDWKQWLKFRDNNKVMLNQIDQQILEEHIKQAEEWK